jgi:hypothetical protein
MIGYLLPGPLAAGIQVDTVNSRGIALELDRIWNIDPVPEQPNLSFDGLIEEFRGDIIVSIGVPGPLCGDRHHVRHVLLLVGDTI